MKAKTVLRALKRVGAVIALLLTLLWTSSANAQTTISTSTAAAFAVVGVTFVVENTNATPIQITNVGLQVQATSNGGTATLYASTSSLSGSTVIPGAGWTSVSSATITS
ncbi:MAG: hypothetical protein WAT74_06540, partial [Flavobacteriales bacterium]